jgi:hypothetical protein
MMEEDILKSELEQVTAELASARTEYASLGAKIAGLEARRVALARAIPETQERSLGGINVVGKYRTDDIVELLVAAGTEMSISDVIAALHDAGRPHEIYDNVSADLAYLAERGRIARVRRGVYTAIHESQTDPDRIIIPLTQGNLTNKHVYLARHLGFFPSDAIGSHNKEAGQGTRLKLHFDGLPEAAETDIDPNHKIFRLRDRHWQEFFERHDLRAGDKVAIEGISEYEYRILPIPSSRAGVA